jgi:hypothetical protein
LIPSTLLFIASDAVDIASQIRLIDGDSCPEFDRWLQLKRSGIVIDFRRIQRVGFDVPYFGDYMMNVSAFETRSIMWDFDEVPSQMYHRIEDESLVFMKSKPLLGNIEKSEIEHEIETLINLRHLCIAAPIGFIFGIESGSQQELKIVRLYLEGCSLSEVVSVNPFWWTSTVKAEAVAEIVLGLRFAHRLGLVHGHLTTNNILFDSDHCIQIGDFNPILLEVDESESASEDGTQIVFGHRPQGEASIPTNIPDFVSRIIKSGLSSISGTGYSFNTILDSLKQNKFEIEDDVDSGEVSAFVSWVESAEYPNE